MLYSVSAVFEYLAVEEDMNFIVQCLLIAVIAQPLSWQLFLEVSS
jgi:hypothetical protein